MQRLCDHGSQSLLLQPLGQAVGGSGSNFNIWNKGFLCDSANVPPRMYSETSSRHRADMCAVVEREESSVVANHINHSGSEWSILMVNGQHTHADSSCFFARLDPGSHGTFPGADPGPEGWIHRMVQRLLEGEVSVLQLFASLLGGARVGITGSLARSRGKRCQGHEKLVEKEGVVCTKPEVVHLREG